MRRGSETWPTHLRQRVRAALQGPQILAFLPAITLSGYWLGGEAVLVFIALIMPLAFAVGGLYSRDGRGRAFLDPITDLPLREEVVDQTDHLLSEGPTRAGTTASLAIGIDEFQETVERFGNDAGAQILRACAERLRLGIRTNDLICRLDGPCFGIVLSSGARADLESLIQLSTRIQKQMQEPISLEGTRIFCSVSVGFCTPKRCPEPSGDALILAAEQALADATANGTGAIRAFTIDMQRRARSRGALSDDLPRALEEDQIRPWFQPQVNCKTGEVTGFEVLARWEHPETGLIPPAQFLPAAESLGLLGRLGEVMLYNSLNALRAWDANGTEVPTLSLNFSAEELRNPTIVDRIRWELDRFDLGPERLTVEVLETVIAQTANDTIIHNLRAFSEMGCLIDLDDFGTGHASIANIKRFSVGRIKIDRTFVTQIDTDTEQQNIVSAILTLAERLQLETLAEGVENTSEQAVLRQLGCGFIQGYGIARPMPFDEVEGWLAGYRKTLTSNGGAASQDPAQGRPPATVESGKTA